MDQRHRDRLLETYRAAVDYLDRELIRLTPRRRSPEDKVRAALAFNRELGDPQRAFPTIQVAGTSGKGSVAQLVAGALSAAGLRTGCHVSPYLQAFTEKTAIDGRYLEVERLASAVEELRPVAERLRADPECPASVHGMASLAVSYLAFRDAALDVAVIETGLGGRFDLVQGLRRELCVITELGLDHTTSLGPTLEEIAWHKAGIMEPGVPCVAARGDGWRVLEEEAHRIGAPLEGVELAPVTPGAEGAVTVACETLGEIELPAGSRAPFALRNAVLAAAVVDRLARAGWPVAAEHLRTAVRQPVPGRFESVGERPRVILDCAHNSQKAAALAHALAAGGVERSTLVVAVTGSRSPGELLEPLAPIARRLVATELELYGKATQPAAAVAEAARALGIPCDREPVPERALDRALQLTPPGAAVVVAGSVYLAGRLRDRWHPTEEIVLQRTSWPARRRGQHSA